MSNRPIPDLHLNDSDCCGCGACYAVCPVRAIAMIPDELGFLNPVINEKRCIRCKKCISVCDFKSNHR